MTTSTISPTQTIIVLSNDDWVYVPKGVDPDAYRAEQEAVLTLTVKEGVFFNEEINEWEVWAGGEAVAWGETRDEAWRSYHEMADDTDLIPFTGEPVFPSESLSETDTYGLELPL